MEDRELDMLVAEKVMGLRPWDGGVGLLIDESGGVIHADHLMAYSTEIADAWEVVEKMRQLTPQRLVSIRDWEPVWHVNVLTMSQEPKFSVSEDASVCRAICLAALRAVGVEV